VKRETRFESGENDCRDPAARLHPPARLVTMTAVLRTASRAALDQIMRHRFRIAMDDPEALHQVRVGFRHLDAAIRFFVASISKSECVSLARELKWFGRKLSRAREIDVFLEDVISRAPRGKRGGPDIAALELLCRREQEHEYAHVRRVLASGRFQDFASAIEGGLIEGRALLPGPHDSSDQAAARLMDMKRTLRKGRHIDTLRRDDLHKLRLRVKRLRYAIGFVAPLLNRKNTKPARHMSELLRRLQNELGATTDQKAHKDFFEELRECGSSRFAAGDDEIDWRDVKHLLFRGHRKAKATSLKRAKKIYREFEEIALS
jgi:CHAD domain-containing protein